MMRLWCLIGALVAGFAGPVAAMVCWQPPNPPGFSPENPLATKILSVTGVPDGETSFLAFGTLVPTHKQPLLHQSVLELLAQRWPLEADGSLETSDTDMQFFYRAHFVFSGVFFDGQAWVETDGDTTQVSLTMIGEGGYYGGIPEGPSYMALTRSNNPPLWFFDAGLCPTSVSLAPSTNAEAQAELASCLPLGNCLD